MDMLGQNVNISQSIEQIAMCQQRLATLNLGLIGVITVLNKLLMQAASESYVASKTSDSLSLVPKYTVPADKEDKLLMTNILADLCHCSRQLSCLNLGGRRK